MGTGEKARAGSRSHRAVVVLVLAATALGIGAGLSSSAAAGAQTTTLPSSMLTAPRVIAISTVLREYRTGGRRTDITVRAKLVELARVEAIDPELAYCFTDPCQPGELVWMVLEDGPVGSFDHPTPSGAPPGLGSWSLFLVDASTGVRRPVSEVGNAGDLSKSPWGRLEGGISRPPSTRG